MIMIMIMSESLIEALWNASERERTLAAGSVLFRAGDRVRSLYFVVTGEMRLVRSIVHGLQLTLQRAGPGAILAEASLFAGTYRCDAVAAEASVLRAAPLRRIEATLATEPRLARAWTNHLAQEVQRARAHAETLSLRTVAERLDAWTALNEGALPPKGRWRYVAAEIGVTPEAFYREIARRRQLA